MVMFLYRDEYYNKDTEAKNIAEVIIAQAEKTAPSALWSWSGCRIIQNLEIKSTIPRTIIKVRGLCSFACA